MRRPWTTGELRLLRARAGRRTARAIARELGRTPQSVEMRMKRMGLSRAAPEGEVCPGCGRLRTGIADGLCPVCRQKAVIRRLRAEEAALAASMPEWREPSRSGDSDGSRGARRPGETDAEVQERELADARRESGRIRRRVQRMRRSIEEDPDGKRD